MQTIILAGGKGTRMADGINDIPKPLIKIGDFPLLWHIMKIYSCYKIKDFNVACGFKGEKIKNYFNKFEHQPLLNQIKSKKILFNSKLIKEKWNVKLIDTGEETMTGGRIKIIINLINSKQFMVTYGDGLSNVNIKNLITLNSLLFKKIS